MNNEDSHMQYLLEDLLESAESNEHGWNKRALVECVELYAQLSEKCESLDKYIVKTHRMASRLKNVQAVAAVFATTSTFVTALEAALKDTIISSYAFLVPFISLIVFNCALYVAAGLERVIDPDGKLVAAANCRRDFQYAQGRVKMAMVVKAKYRQNDYALFRQDLDHAVRAADMQLSALGIVCTKRHFFQVPDLPPAAQEDDSVRDSTRFNNALSTYTASSSTTPEFEV